MTGRRILSREDIEAAAAMRERGLSYRQIATKFGCSPSAISWHCLKEGAEPPKPWPVAFTVRGPLVVRRGNHFVRRYTSEEDAQIREMALDGKSCSEIGRAIGRKWNSIRGRLMTLARHDHRAGL